MLPAVSSISSRFSPPVQAVTHAEWQHGRILELEAVLRQAEAAAAAAQRAEQAAAAAAATAAGQAVS